MGRLHRRVVRARRARPLGHRRGGRGTGEGVGLGKVGTIGHGAGTGTGQGFGSGHGRLGRSHRAKPKGEAEPKKKARVRVRRVEASGLEKAAVKRKLEKKRSAFRACYRSALSSDPDLAGSIRLRFRVNASGSAVVGKKSEAILSSVSESAARCALDVVSGLTFPAPEGDGATVTFELALGSR